MNPDSGKSCSGHLDVAQEHAHLLIALQEDLLLHRRPHLCLQQLLVQLLCRPCTRTWIQEQVNKYVNSRILLQQLL